MHNIGLLSAMITLAAFGTAHAKPVTSAHCGVSFDTPDGWKVTERSPDELVMQDPKREAIIWIVCTDRAHLAKLPKPEAVLSLEKLTTSEPKKIDIGGMKAVIENGDAQDTRTGNAMVVSLVLISTPGDRRLIASTAIRKAMMKSHVLEVAQMMSQIRTTTR